MKDRHNDPPATERERLDRAAQWFMRLRDPQFDADQLDDWLQWGNQDERNLAAFEGIRDLAQGLASLDPGQQSQILHECSGHPLRMHPRNHARRWRIGAALAASILVGLATLAYFGVAAMGNRTFRDNYETVAGQTRSIELPDGSSMELAAKSSVKVVYAPQVRTIELAAGEAWFHVHHDAGRSFVVHAGGLRLTDIGTIFDVRKVGEKVVVSVAEGAVQASYHKPGAWGAKARSASEVTLVAGQQFTANGAAAVVTHVAADDVAAWRSGRLRFLDTPLSTVVSELNRYSSRQVILGDPAIGRMRFTGTVFINRIDAWVAAIDRIFPVRAQAQADGRTVLYLKKQS